MLMHSLCVPVVINMLVGFFETSLIGDLILSLNKLDGARGGLMYFPPSLGSATDWGVWYRLLSCLVLISALLHLVLYY